MKTRRRFTAEFKAKVALEAIRGERTISELATKHQLHPNQITRWKRQAIGVFAYLIATGNDRVTNLIATATDIFRFTGGSDDIRAALYASAIHVFTESPVSGIGFGQIMLSAQQLYPEQAKVFTLNNLHADWANFTAMAGGMGLVAWLLLLLAPLLLLVGPLAREVRPLVLGAARDWPGRAGRKQCYVWRPAADYGLCGDARLFPDPRATAWHIS